MNKSKAQNLTPINSTRFLATVATDELTPYQELYSHVLSVADFEEMKSNLVAYLELLIELDKQSGVKPILQGDIVESNTENNHKEKN